MALKRLTEKNTKAEILAAFNALLQEKNSLQTQLVAQPVEPPRNGKSAPEPTPPAPVSPLSAPPPQNMQAILAGLNQLQLNMGGAVSDLSEKLTLQAFQLQEAQRSRTEAAAQLEALHGISASEANLETLLQQYEQRFKACNEELRLRRETIDQRRSKAEKAWAKEQEDYRRSLRDRNDTQVKIQRRDGEEYTYTLNLERQLADEAAEQEQKRLYQELQETRQTQERQWAEREKTIADRETQFAELKAKVEAQPKELEAALKRAKEEGKGIVSQQAKVKADLLGKEIEGSQRTYELRIQSLLGTIQTQDTRLQALATQLDAALKQVQDLAVKAIEGASNVNSFQAVKEIAIEQAKNQNKAK